MDFGKFASAEELLKSYNQLEKSFTQKCQQLSALEREKTLLEEKLKGGTSENTPPQERVQSTTVDSADTVPQDAFDAKAVLNGQAPVSTAVSADGLQQLPSDGVSGEGHTPQPMQDAPLQLQNVAAVAAPSVMSGGGNVSMALPSRPKTLKEASLMAKELFK